MKGGAVFLAFFLFFVLVSLTVPIPLFPGNVIHVWFGIPQTAYSALINALANGLVYGFMVWAVFLVVNKRFGEPWAEKPREKRRSSKKSSTSR